MGELATSPTLTVEYQSDDVCRILALDGGGAKGFYTLGVLEEIEGMLKCPLYKRFDLVFGTSTGAIIASLIALGYALTKFTTFTRSTCRASWRRDLHMLGLRHCRSWPTKYSPTECLKT